MQPTLIHGARVIDPASGHDDIADVLLNEAGLVGAIGVGLSEQIDDQTLKVDGRGRWLLPGFVDLHVHLREPGHEYKETVATGSASAVAGGFTTMLCMANTVPVNDTGSVTRYIVERARSCGLARVLPIGALSKGLKGKELAEVGDMIEQGAVAISDDGMPVMDAHLMRRGLEYARTLGVPVIAHEEDSCLSRGCMHEGPVATELGLPGVPSAAEDVMVARDIVLAELTGAHLHIAHVSTAGAVRMIREAQARGLRVTTELTPHHFSLTDEALRGYDPDFRMSPPLRAEQDRLATIEGLRDGTIQCIATDHAPHATSEKELEIQLAANGVVGLETAWGLTMQLVRNGELDLVRAVELLTSGPADCFGLEGLGRIAVGGPGDLVLIDPEASQIIVAAQLHSKSKNTPFKGWELPTRVERTWFGGRTVFSWDGEEGRVAPEQSLR